MEKGEWENYFSSFILAHVRELPFPKYGSYTKGMKV